MALKIASDIHGAYDELHEQLACEDTLILLGDYLDLIDYEDLSGMIAEFIPQKTIRAILDLISSGDLEQAKTHMNAAAISQGNLFEKIEELSHDRYEHFFSGIPCTTYLIWGNVDFPHVLKQHLKPNTNLITGAVLEIQGRRCGFVSGSPPMRYSFGMPGEMSREAFRKAQYGLGPVDHLFVHPPPAIEDLAFDVQAGRDEEGSLDLLTFIEAYQPKTVHFGHVHEPRATTLTHNEKTLMINAGHFRRTNTLIEL